jgi:hypothetical protein
MSAACVRQSFARAAVEAGSNSSGALAGSNSSGALAGSAVSAALAGSGAVGVRVSSVITYSATAAWA